MLLILPVFISSMSTKVINGTLDTLIDGNVNSSVQIIYQFFVNASDLYQKDVGASHNALRAYASSDDSNPEEPLTIVVKQRRGVLSWELPYMVGSESFAFARRTLCPYENIKSFNSKMRLVGGEKESELELITISVSTASKTNVNYKINLYKQNNFTLKMNHTYEIPNTGNSEVLSPSSPIFYYFEFEENQESALITLKSDDDICMTLSIQDASCPVLDLN